MRTVFNHLSTRVESDYFWFINVNFLHDMRGHFTGTPYFLLVRNVHFLMLCQAGVHPGGRVAI